MTAAEVLLEVRGLRIDIATVSGVLTPVRSVDVTVNRGETVAIVGESGCGKSLTALAIMGLPPATARLRGDRLALAGESLVGIPARRLRRIRGERMAMVFQDPMTALDPCYRIGDQLAEVLRQHRRVSRRAARARALELLEKVGIPEAEARLDQYPHQLSGGMRQRVMIAMALMCEPELIIADEPTTALDVTIQVQILGLLRRLQAETGFGLLPITHDPGVVASTADRIVVMYGGEVVEAGPCNTVLAAPLHPYTEGLLQSLPQVEPAGDDTRLGFIPGTVPRQSGPRQSCGFLDRCPYRHAPCAADPVPMVDAGPGHVMRCLLPVDGAGRDISVWSAATEATP